MSTRVTRKAENLHDIMLQHVGHDVNLRQHENHVYLECTTCTQPASEQFVINYKPLKYMVLKTYEQGTFVAFYISSDPTADRVMDK